MTVVFHVGGDGGSITVTSNMEKNDTFQTLCEKPLISKSRIWDHQFRFVNVANKLCKQCTQKAHFDDALKTLTLIYVKVGV